MDSRWYIQLCVSHATTCTSWLRQTVLHVLKDPHSPHTKTFLSRDKDRLHIVSSSPRWLLDVVIPATLLDIASRFVDYQGSAFEPNLEADLIFLGNDGFKSRIPALATMVWCQMFRTRADKTGWARQGENRAVWGWRRGSQWGVSSEWVLRWSAETPGEGPVNVSFKPTKLLRHLLLMQNHVKDAVRDTWAKPNQPACWWCGCCIKSNTLCNFIQMMLFMEKKWAALVTDSRCDTDQLKVMTSFCRVFAHDSRVHVYRPSQGVLVTRAILGADECRAFLYSLSLPRYCSFVDWLKNHVTQKILELLDTEFDSPCAVGW